MNDDDKPADDAAAVRKPGRFEMARRRFLYTIGVVILGAAATYGYATRIEPHWLRVRRRDMPIEGLPAALDGKTVLHLSDLHIGPRVDDAYLARVMKTARDLAPDLLAITGDLIDGDFPVREGTAWDALHAVLDALPAAPLGRFAVLGNHDYGHNWSNYANAERLVGEYESRGVQVLRNATAPLMHGLQVVGIDDLWADRTDIPAAFGSATPGAPTLVLVHNPDVCDMIGWPSHQPGWVLAGHTHGGQCKPPFLPPPLLPVANRHYTRGVFELGAGRFLNISAGVGYLTKARFLVPPEIVLFTLQRRTP